MRTLFSLVVGSVLVLTACAGSSTSAEYVVSSETVETPLDLADRINRNFKQRVLREAAERTSEAVMKERAAKIRTRLAKLVRADMLDVLSAPDTVEILSLYPYQIEDDDEADLQALPRFHGWGVLGHADVVPSDEQRTVGELILESVNDSNGVVEECFEPRHGVRLTRGDVLLELVICFECSQMRMFEKGFSYVPSPTITNITEKDLTRLFLAKGLEFDEDYDPFATDDEEDDDEDWDE